jgi:hypothetical protein
MKPSNLSPLVEQECPCSNPQGGRVGAAPRAGTLSWYHTQRLPEVRSAHRQNRAGMPLDHRSCADCPAT